MKLHYLIYIAFFALNNNTVFGAFQNPLAGYGNMQTILDIFSNLGGLGQPDSIILGDKRIQKFGNEKDIVYVMNYEQGRRYHFILPEYSRAGVWSGQQAVLDSMIVQADGELTFKALLEKIKNTSGSFNWSVKIVKTYGDVYTYKPICTRNCVSVKQCAVNVWILLGPYGSWGDEVMTQSIMDKTNNDGYKMCKDAGRHLPSLN